VSKVLPSLSLRRVCRALDVNRSSLYLSEERSLAGLAGPKMDEEMAGQLHVLVKRHPTFGYRRLWALLRFGQKIPVNLKKVHRIVQLRRWQVKERLVSPRPRVQQKVSRAERSNERWAMDVTHVYCGRDGWGHLAAVVDCHDREVVGFEFALRGRAKEAERALEAACLTRFGTLRPAQGAPTLRSDNGLIFTSKRFREACKFYRLSQEFITPYTPEQNGLVERFFRSLKEECVWQHNFGGFDEARSKIRQWIDWYNQERPHQALGYLSPVTFRQKQRQLVV
jgi:putative transposase